MFLGTGEKFYLENGGSLLCLSDVAVEVLPSSDFVLYETDHYDLRAFFCLFVCVH